MFYVRACVFIQWLKSMVNWLGALFGAMLAPTYNHQQGHVAEYSPKRKRQIELGAPHITGFSRRRTWHPVISYAEDTFPSAS